jgi:hypothetical protein
MFRESVGLHSRLEFDNSQAFVESACNIDTLSVGFSMSFNAVDGTLTSPGSGLHRGSTPFSSSMLYETGGLTGSGAFEGSGSIDVAGGLEVSPAAMLESTLIDPSDRLGTPRHVKASDAAAGSNHDCFDSLLVASLKLYDSELERETACMRATISTRDSRCFLNRSASIALVSLMFQKLLLNPYGVAGQMH